MSGVFWTSLFDLCGPRRKRIAKNAAGRQRTWTEVWSAWECQTWLTQHRAPSFFLDVLRKDFLTHTPSVHTVHSKKESCFQKSSLDTLGEKWKLAHPTQRQIQLWELDVWWAWAHQLKEVGVSLMRGKDQKGQLLKTCPNNSKACSVIPPFELRRGFWTF